jgi:hypothetical protein
MGCCLEQVLHAAAAGVGAQVGEVGQGALEGLGPSVHGEPSSGLGEGPFPPSRSPLGWL